jgi:5-methylcytosine-specific restriction endonuclease McrA
MNRELIHQKYKGKCAYCGKDITVKNMQIDHVIPKYHGGTNEETNLMPTCRRCNHYKRAWDLESFRDMIRTLIYRLRKIYIVKVAEDYGIIKIAEWDGVFYFEKVKGKR